LIRNEEKSGSGFLDKLLLTVFVRGSGSYKFSSHNGTHDV